MSDPKSKQAPEQIKSIPYRHLFKYATISEKILLVLSIFVIILKSACLPLLILIWGDSTNNFSDQNSGEEIKSKSRTNTVIFVLIGIGTLAGSIIAHTLNKFVTQKQYERIRSFYFRAMLRQELAWYDKNNPSTLSSTIEEDCKNIITGMEEKLLQYVSAVFLLVSCYTIAFIRGWQLTLVVSVLIPMIIITSSLFTKLSAKIYAVKLSAYAKAGAVAEQALYAIKTIVFLNTEKKEAKNYDSHLESTEKSIIRVGFLQGLSFASMTCIFYILLGIGFTVGSRFIQSEVYNSGSGRPYSSGDTITIFFTVVNGVFTIGFMGPSIKAFQLARQTAHKVFSIIDRESLINYERADGSKPNNFSPTILFKDVSFTYPSNSEKKILKSINLNFPANKKVALVGESGSGKSTCVQLIERFYDPESGSITIDGQDLKSLNVHWLRQNISYVGQEPVLFSTTIRKNLELAKDNVTEAEMIDALKKANAYEFIMNLPDKLDTYVGTMGSQISGGQKQRIAIARAIIRNAKILLLDEATSALDNKNEREIQETLDKISEERTTIIVAHRLSTVRNADLIYVLSNGEVKESGNHEELIKKEGFYYELQKTQLSTQTDKHSNEATNSDQVDIKVDDKKESNQASDKKSPEETKVKENKKKDDGVIKRVFRDAKPERKYLILSMIVSGLNGLVSPAHTVLFGKLLAIMLDKNYPDYNRETLLYSSLYYLVAICSILFYGLQVWFFALVSEKYIRRMRSQLFYKLLRMPISWHDDPKNAPALLCTSLSTDSTTVANMVGNTAGVITQIVVAFVAALAISFYCSWQLSLLCLGITPFMTFSAKIRITIASGVSKKDENLLKKAQVIPESINNIKTVAALGKEKFFLDEYSTILPLERKANTRAGIIEGVTVGFSDFVIFVFYALTFLVGSIMAVDYALPIDKMFIGMFVLSFTGNELGNTVFRLPNMAEAEKSARKLYEYLDAKSEIDIDNCGSVKKIITGDVEFKNVSFKYPSREKQILQNLNLKLEPGKKIAFCGPSGCGKSTIMQLLLRLYDVDSGEILINGENIKNYDLSHLRRQFSIVSQEPTLFDGTIEYNIKYSKDDATDKEMRDAADQANALKFVENDEIEIKEEEKKDEKAKEENSGTDGKGFKREVGPKGNKLSGGQKQRIAIARAIIRNPNVLLLDEATSALDSKSEEVVQKSIDKIIEGKSSITIAHRISTIKTSDDIIVFKDGKVVERGNYEQLKEMNGFFCSL